MKKAIKRTKKTYIDEAGEQQQRADHHNGADDNGDQRQVVFKGWQEKKKNLIRPTCKVFSRDKPTKPNWLN